MPQHYDNQPTVDGLREWLRVHVGEGRVLLAVSGGLDSMVLWHLVHESGWPYGVAHVNYHLRGSESLGDQLLVEQTAQQRAVVVDVLSNSTLLGAKGVQARARSIRYDFFRQTMKARGYVCTLVAHHANDQLETLLIALVRGGGPRALAGIREVGDWLFRPLLPYSKAALSAFAKTHGVVFREDASNQSTDYLRNQIRLAVIEPLLATRKNVLANVLRTTAEQQELLAFAEDWVEEVLVSARNDDSTYSCAALAAVSGLGFVVHTWLRPYGFDATVCREVVARISGSNRARVRYESRDREQVVVVGGGRIWLGVV